MTLHETAGYGLITVYGPGNEKKVAKALETALNDRDVRIMTPGDEKTLMQAAANSMAIFIALERPDDGKARLARRLQENRMVHGDIIAFGLFQPQPDFCLVDLLGQGFDGVLTPADTAHIGFRKYLQQLLARGARRLSTQILDEEYRRICDALSNAPSSMIVFDADKRAVFVSDHYFRAYPKIAPRLIRGLSVYDAFEMMMREEGLPRNDQRFAELQAFWHNLEGSIEFALETGISYRLKAVKLPNNRGTVVTGQNISDYQRRHVKLEEKSSQLSAQLKTAMQDHESRMTLIRAMPKEMDNSLKSLREYANKLQVLLLNSENKAVESAVSEIALAAQNLKSFAEKLERLSKI